LRKGLSKGLLNNPKSKTEQSLSIFQKQISCFSSVLIVPFLPIMP
jgi:hypothetical protein